MSALKTYSSRPQTFLCVHFKEQLLLKFSTKIIQAGDAENTYAPRAPAKQRRNAMREKQQKIFRLDVSAGNFSVVAKFFRKFLSKFKKDACLRMCLFV